MTFEPEKWVQCDDLTRPASGIVRDSLSGRLEAVSYFAEPTGTAETHDPEHVHQLRVATRRANAALRAYAAFLPRRKTKRLRQALKRIRRAVGPARDHDVMAHRYATPRDTLPSETHDWLWSRIVDARRASNPAVDDIYARYGGGKFAKLAEKLLDRVQWRGEGDEPTFAVLAKNQLTHAAGKFFESARRRPRRAAGLHQLRIAAKRFRYAIELFAALNSRLRDDIYPVIEEIQELLGKANDHAVAAERIAGWAKRLTNNSPQIDDVAKLVKRERKKAAAAQSEFLAWWTAERSRALEELFDNIVRSATSSGGESNTTH